MDWPRATRVSRGVAIAVILAFGTATSASPQAAESSRVAYRRAHLDMYQRYLSLDPPIGRFAMRQVGGHVAVPHWLADGNRFWYADSRYAGQRVVGNSVYLVDPAANTVRELFDADRLRPVLRRALGHEPEIEGVPFLKFEYTDSAESVIRFQLEERTFELALETYRLTPSEPDRGGLDPRWGRCGAERATEVAPSPDGRWVACVVDFDAWLVSAKTGSEEPITEGGVATHAWHVGADPDRDRTAWSPDGRYLVLQREDRRRVPKAPSIRWLSDPPEVVWFPNDPPGQPPWELHLYEPAHRELRRIDLDGPAPWWIGIIGWRPDSSVLVVETATRAGTQEDMLALDPASGASHLLHSESADAPVLPDLMWSGQVAGRLTIDGNELIYVSEESGSLQLHVLNLDTGSVRQLTSGSYPVIRLVDVDEDGGWVYYTAFGDPDRPYDAHFYRVRLDGSSGHRLTELGASNEPTGMVAYFFGHRTSIHLSPTRKYFVARPSTPSRLPVIELRRSDGTLVRRLSEARLGPIAEELRWTPPEEFVVKAADGLTDLWGVMWKPYDFDPTRRYPVIEVFYDEQVPRTFDPTPHGNFADRFAQLGFVTVMLEGRGASWRGTAFRNAFVGRPGAFIEDHAAAIRNLAAEHSYIDPSRVGAYGYSGGADDALWAMLRASGTYGVGVSVAPGSRSEEGRRALISAVDGLEGPLLLVHGTADRAMPFSFTMSLVDVFIRAGKRIDLLVIPDAGHGLGDGWEYHFDRARDFFLEHLDPRP